MKRLLPIFIALIIFLLSTIVSYGELGSFAGSLNSRVSGTLGEFYLNLSGYQSPYASIILTSDGIFLRATVADENGRFTISDVLIKRGFTHFCLLATDFKRIGESETCFTTPPAEASVTIKNIFLPPTLGLQRNEIAEGSSALAFGYTRPGAKVTLYLSNGQTLVVTADNTGYYQFKINNLKAGKYEIYTKAVFDGQESKAPAKKLSLHSLSWWEQFIAFLKDIWKHVLLFLSSLSLGPLWLVIPIIILIIILIVKLWPGKFKLPKLPGSREALIGLPKGKDKKSIKMLHHGWFLGY